MGWVISAENVGTKEIKKKIRGSKERHSCRKKIVGRLALVSGQKELKEKLIGSANPTKIQQEFEAKITVVGHS